MKPIRVITMEDWDRIEGSLPNENRAREQCRPGEKYRVMAKPVRYSTASSMDDALFSQSLATETLEFVWTGRVWDCTEMLLIAPRNQKAEAERLMQEVALLHTVVHAKAPPPPPLVRVCAATGMRERGPIKHQPMLAPK